MSRTRLKRGKFVGWRHNKGVVDRLWVFSRGRGSKEPKTLFGVHQDGQWKGRFEFGSWR